jgi:CheY-like chemotaxis protein
LTAELAMTGLAGAASVVLMVDDDPSNLFATTELLQTYGYMVLRADTGEGALTTLGSIVPDLIIANLRLPGMNGAQTIRELRRRPGLASTKALLVSAADLSEIRARMRESGYVGEFLRQPLAPEQLMAEVSRLCPPMHP